MSKIQRTNDGLISIGNLKIVDSPALGIGIQIPKGHTYQRPTVVLPGAFRYNTDTGRFEGFNGIGWVYFQDFPVPAEASSENTSTNYQTDTVYTLQISDQGKVISMNNSVPNTVIIPANSSASFPVGATIGLLQDGLGQTSVSIIDDTLNSNGSKTKLAGQYSYATLVKVDSTRWILAGDITN